tara:strand:+ start:1068 stop:1508 length:441 start_codon:yes stop_codon:yes gene_type:complete
MNDDFYASIKLVSGEEIFAITSSEEDTLIIQDPVCIESVHGPRGSYLRIEPWMQVPKDQFYFIDKSKIITMTEVDHDHEMVEYYTNYLLDAAEDRANGFRSTSNSNGKVKPSEKMGYLGTVNTAKKKLEELFQLEVDPKAGIATHV